MKQTRPVSGLLLLSGIVLTGVVATRGSAPVKRPNFSGSWQQISRSCQPSETRSKPLRLVIDHKDTAFRIVSQSEAGKLALAYEVGGKPLHYTGLDGDDFRTRARWQGNSLVFDTKETEDGHLVRAQESWELVENGAKLRRTKREDGPGEHSRCTSIFETDTSSPVQVTIQKDRIAVSINGQPFTNLYIGAEAHKPFLYPLTTASGQRVTRGFPVDPVPGDPTDHPHQKGLWVASEHLSSMDFWENDPSYKRPNMGTIVFKDVLATETTADRGSFTMLADWVNLQGESVLTETRKMTFYANPTDCRMFDVDLNLHAKRELTFEDHHDSVIGIRLGPAFDEKNGGRPINAHGQEGEAETRGKSAEWIDWQTTLNGEKVGVTLMDHPSNYNAPTRWHIRSMGLLVASTFARRDYDPEAEPASKTLQPSEDLHLRYRVLIHPQSTDVAKIYGEFAAQ